MKTFLFFFFSQTQIIIPSVCAVWFQGVVVYMQYRDLGLTQPETRPEFHEDKCLARKATADLKVSRNWSPGAEGRPIIAKTSIAPKERSDQERNSPVFIACPSVTFTTQGLWKMYKMPDQLWRGQPFEGWEDFSGQNHLSTEIKIQDLVCRILNKEGINTEGMSGWACRPWGSTETQGQPRKNHEHWICFLQASQRTTEIKERKVLEWPAFQRKRTDFSTLEFNGKSKILVRFMENLMPEVSKESHVLNSLCMLKN